MLKSPTSPAWGSTHPAPLLRLPSPASPKPCRVLWKQFPLFSVLQKVFIQEQLKKATVVWIPKREMVPQQGLLALGQVCEC